MILLPLSGSRKRQSRGAKMVEMVVLMNSLLFLSDENWKELILAGFFYSAGLKKGHFMN